MSFKPAGDRHAIQEVVFIVNFQRALTAVELDRFYNSHDAWRPELPKSERPAVMQFFVGPGAPNGPPPPVVAPAIFQSFRRDGGLDWQMQANQNWLAVNCLTYTRWDAISKQAMGLLEKGFLALGDDGLQISAVTLQYIDLFIWDGELDSYDISDLVVLGSQFVPSDFKSDGPGWHIHTGSFDLSGTLQSGRRLMRRVHLDSQIENGTAVTRMDVSLTADYSADNGSHVPYEFNGVVSEFSKLHDENKSIMACVLSKGMQERISLHGVAQ